MSILIGSNKANKMYWGSTPVKSVFLGANKVWPSTKPRWVVGTGADSQKMYYSDDAATWTYKPSAIATSYDVFDDIEFANGLYVAVGRHNSSEGVAYSSQDGLTWTRNLITTTSGNRMKAVVYGNGVFLAPIRNSNKARYSADGTTWSEKPLPISGDWLVGFGGGKFVLAAGGARKDGIYYSTNGTTWTACTIPQDADHYIQINGAGRIAYGNGTFYLHTGSTSYKPLMSTDGVTWSWAGTAPNDFYAVDYGAGLFVAVRPYAYIYTSPDLTTWTQRNAPGGTSALWRNLKYVGGTFLLTGDRSAVGKSTNGTSWSETSTSIIGSDYAYAIGYGEVDADA